MLFMQVGIYSALATRELHFIDCGVSTFCGHYIPLLLPHQTMYL